MSVVAQLSGPIAPPIAPGGWLPCKPPKGQVGVVPYIRTPVLTLDTDIVYVSVVIDGVPRRAWVLPPTATPTGAEAVQVQLENVARNLGCRGAGSPLQAVVGTPATTTGLTAYVPLDQPLQLLFLATPVGAAVMGASPTPAGVSSAPVPLTWTAPPAAPAVFPPPMPASAGALRFGTLFGRPTDGVVYTGTPYAVSDNGPQRNPLVALPVAGYDDVFTLAICPPGIPDSGALATLPVVVTLVWPTCSVPVGRTVLLPARVNARAVLDPCAVKPRPGGNSCSTCPVFWTST